MSDRVSRTPKAAASTNGTPQWRDMFVKVWAVPFGPSQGASLLLHFAIVVAIFALGFGLLWSAMTVPITIEGLSGLQAKWGDWRQVTLVLFVVGVSLLFFQITRYGPFYPLTVFFVSLAAVQQLVFDAVMMAWPSDQDIVNVPFNGITLQRLMFVIIGLYVIGFALVTLTFRPIQDRPESTGAGVVPVGPSDTLSQPTAALRAEDERRRRIRAYFSARPLWPWVASSLGIALMTFAVVGIPELQEKMFINGNKEYLPSLFGISALALLFEDRKREPMYYFNMFVVLLWAGTLLSNWATGYPISIRFEWIRQINDESQQPPIHRAAQEALISYYFWYWLLMGALVTTYAAAFQFVVYPRWHLASDAEVDNCIASDFKNVIERAFARLGVDRSLLIAEPLSLRGFPDRSVLSNVFFGSWVDEHDRLRFTPQTATVVAFTEDQVLYFEMTVDLTTGVTVNETNVEFFYQDVSNVARVSTTEVIQYKSLWSMLGWVKSLFSRSEGAMRREMKRRSINDTVQLPGRDVFQINLDSGRAMVIVLRDNSFFDTKRKRVVSALNAIKAASGGQFDQRDADLPFDENERAMRSIRSMLRNKKRTLLLEQR